MTVRYANLGDVPAILELARQEHEASPWARVPFDDHATTRLIESFVCRHGQTMLVCDGGYLAGMLQPYGFSTAIVAVEFAWFCRSGQGLALLQRFEKWAQRCGAVGVMVHNHLGDSRLPHVLQRRKGFRLVGEAFYKDTEA